MITNNFNKDFGAFQMHCVIWGILAAIAMTTKQKFLSKDIWARTAETQPFFAFLSIIQNFSLRRVVMMWYSLVFFGNRSWNGRMTLP